MDNFEYKEEYKYLTDICLNVTDDCCAACKYCFVQQQPHYMSLQTAKDITLWLLKNRELKKQNEPVKINFFGGEPTLCWDSIIVPLVNWIKENNYPVTFGITTNGMLLNEERIKWLYNNKIGLLLSIDGDEYTQNYNRPYKGKEKSFDLVSKNIPYILKYYPNITFRATVDIDTVEHTFENYLFALKSGFRNIFLAPNERTQWPQKKLDALREELAKIFSFMSFCFNNNCFPLHFSEIDNMILYIFKNDICYRSREACRCGLGTIAGAIGYDGSIYGCQEQVSNPNSKFYLGNIYKNGIEIELHKELLKNYLFDTKIQENELCKKCFLRENCINNICPSVSYDLFQNFHTKTLIDCYWHNWIYLNSITLIKELNDKNNETFVLYVKESLNNAKTKRTLE